MKEELELLAQKTASEIAKIEPGTFITHLAMENFLGESRLSGGGALNGRYYSLVARVRKLLKVDHGLWVKTHVRRGYEIVCRGHEIERCVADVYGGLKRVRRAAGDVNYIRLSEIADTDLRTKTIETGQAIGNLTLLLSRSALPAS